MRWAPTTTLKGAVEGHTPSHLQCDHHRHAHHHPHRAWRLLPTTNHIPGIHHKASAQVRAPGDVTTKPPPPPPERVRVEGALFAFGRRTKGALVHARIAPLHPHHFQIGRRRLELHTSWGSNPGAGLGYTKGSGWARCLWGLQGPWRVGACAARAGVWGGGEVGWCW